MSSDSAMRVSSSPARLFDWRLVNEDSQAWCMCLNLNVKVPSPQSHPWMCTPGSKIIPKDKCSFTSLMIGSPKNRVFYRSAHSTNWDARNCFLRPCSASSLPIHQKKAHWEGHLPGLQFAADTLVVMIDGGRRSDISEAPELQFRLNIPPAHSFCA